MLRIIQNSHAAGAKSYYSQADYYTEGQELTGVWQGKGAERLGLNGEVEKADWDALCDNLHPATGRVLTSRQNESRRVGYDFNFHVPKSVSLIYGLTGDERILDTFRESVRETMCDMESEMQTRVRSKDRNEDRTTGEMVWGEFIHTTARPVDGVPDPHLHAHCFVANCTWDAKENRWKAGQFANLKRDAPYFEAVFHSRLAQNMEALGMPIVRTRNGWDLDGLSQDTLATFSRRTKLIEDKAREKGVLDPDAKGALGAKTRERKHSELSLPELRNEWRSRLSTEEGDTIQAVTNRIGGAARERDTKQVCDAVTHAIGHCFDRDSVVPERKVLAEALKHSYGEASPEQIANELASRNLITASRLGRRVVTTEEILREEQRMLNFAREGRGSCWPLTNDRHTFARDWLNDGQRRAVEHVLSSRDRVVVIRGAAGVGKTTMMQEAVEAIEATGKKVFTFAPSANASRGVLRDEGFENADTVSRLLLDEKLQKQVENQVIWVDEAGQLGSQTMAKLFELTDHANARVILSGDKRQHGSVARGAALRLLESEAGIRPAEITDIMRQKDAYKEAVKALSEGRTELGFKRLDRMKSIKEVPKTERYEMLADDYIAALKGGKKALVVAPTHLEGEWATDVIRSKLSQEGRLGQEEHTLPILKNANLTEAQRADPVNYSPSDELVFHQNARGFTRGDRVQVTEELSLPLDQAARFQLFHRDELPIAPGEILRITRNGKTADERHDLRNGALVKVKCFDKEGNIVLTNSWTISKNYGHLAHGYVATSHASQGMSVDRVLIAQSSQSFPASSREQFYVSASRAKEQVTVYTDDKQDLLQAVRREDDRLSATEVAREQHSRDRAQAILRHALHSPARGSAAIVRAREEVSLVR